VELWLINSQRSDFFSYTTKNKDTPIIGGIGGNGGIGGRIIGGKGTGGMNGGKTGGGIPMVGIPGPPLEHPMKLKKKKMVKHGAPNYVVRRINMRQT
jgi:hypothetical protein